MSPVTALHTVASQPSDAPKEVTNRPTTASFEAVSSTPEAAAKPAVAGAPAAASENASTKASETAAKYSVRTSFDAATGEWALVVERHPPEVGVVVAEQKGFVSQYSAMANSPTNLNSGFSAKV